MKITGQLGVLLLAVFLCVAFALVFCLTFWLDAACLNEQRRIVMKAAGSVGCFEFWFNRYQTLVGAFLATAAAGMTLWFMRKQIAAARAQSAAAALERLEARLALIDQMESRLKKLKEILVDLSAKSQALFRTDMVSPATDFSTGNGKLSNEVEALASNGMLGPLVSASLIAELREFTCENNKMYEKLKTQRPLPASESDSFTQRRRAANAALKSAEDELSTRKEDISRRRHIQDRALLGDCP